MSRRSPLQGLRSLISELYSQRGEDAEEMRSSLATFLEQRPLDKVDDLTSRREIAIVSFISLRSTRLGVSELILR